MTTVVVERAVGSDLFLFDPVRDEVHILNVSARLIYELHRQGKGLGEIESAIKATLRGAGDLDLQENILGCLESLKGKGLITVDNQGRD
jgi:hypothetical protein